MASCQPKVVILGATFNTGNMGVSMLAAGAIRCVLHRFPTASIMLIDYAYKGHEFHFLHDRRLVPVRFVNLRFSKKVHLPNNIALLIALTLLAKVIPFRALRERILSRNLYLKELLNSDVVFALSGGDSFSDIYGIGRFLYVALPQLLALFAGKRLVFLPQTIGPFRSGVVRAIGTYIMNRAERIYSRDHIGLHATRRLLERPEDDDRLRFCYDLAFDVDPAAPAVLRIEGLAETRQDGPPLVGLNVSGLLLAGGYTQDNMFGLKVSYQKLVDATLEFLIEHKAANVLLVPHVFGDPNDIESDVHACEQTFARWRSEYADRLGIARGVYDYNEIKYVIGLCDFFVGARMHACIGAISQSIPTVPIAYSDKFAGMMRVIGLGDLVVDPRQMDLDEILRVLEQVYDDRAAVRSGLEQRIPAVKETIRNALADVPGPVRA